MSRFALSLVIPSALFLPMVALAQEPAVQQQLPSPTQQQNQNSSTALSPDKRAILQQFGTFIQSDKYGEVWTPTATPQNWHPYMACNWVNTKQFGWFYQDNTPWGNIVHHYGRWAFDTQKGWLWIPGAEFSPGWVVWRSSPEWVGWAPIPPQADAQLAHTDAFNNGGFWTFIETQKFNTGCSGQAAPASQVPMILKRTQFITRFVNRGGVAVYVMPTYISGSFVNISIDYMPWTDIFYQQFLLSMTWVWTTTEIVTDKRYVDCGETEHNCPPGQAWDEFYKVCSEGAVQHPPEGVGAQKQPLKNYKPNPSPEAPPNKNYSPKPSPGPESAPGSTVPPVIVPVPVPLLPPPPSSGGAYCPPNMKRVGNDCILVGPSPCPPGQIKNPEGLCHYPKVENPLPNYPVKCPPGQHKDANGDCTVLTQPPSQKDCGPGFHRDPNGQCTTAPDHTGNRPSPTECQPGFHRDSSGNCTTAPDGADKRPSPKPDNCRPGQHKDANGECTSASDLTGPKQCGLGLHLDSTGNCVSLPNRGDKNTNDANKVSCGPGFIRESNGRCLPLRSPIDRSPGGNSPSHSEPDTSNNHAPPHYPSKNLNNGGNGSSTFMPGKLRPSYPQLKTCPNGTVVRFGGRCPTVPNYQDIGRPRPQRPSYTKPNVNNLSGGGGYNPQRPMQYHPLKIPPSMMNTHPSAGRPSLSGSQNSNTQGVKRWVPYYQNRTYPKPQ